MRFLSDNVHRIDKVCGKEQQRPGLLYPFLRVVTEGKGKNKRTTGLVEATDSYKLVRVPVEFDEWDEPTEGYLPPEMFAKIKQAMIVNVKPDVVMLQVKGETITYERPKLDSQWPNVTQLLPNAETEMSSFTLGINARFLYELAQGLGSDQVALTFHAGGSVHIPDEKTGEVEHYRTPNKLRPILVASGQGTARLVETGPIGLIMPVRVEVDLPYAPEAVKPKRARTARSNGTPAKGRTKKPRETAKSGA